MNGLYGNDFSAVMSADIMERRNRDARRALALETLLTGIASKRAQQRDARDFDFRKQQADLAEKWRQENWYEQQARDVERRDYENRRLKLDEDWLRFQQQQMQKQSGQPTAAESAFLRKQAEDAAKSGMFDPRAFPDLTHEESQALAGVNNTVRGQAEAEHAQLQGIANLLNRQRRLQVQLRELDDERNQRSPYWQRNASWLNPIGKIADWVGGNTDDVAVANAEDRKRFTAEKQALDQQINDLRAGDKNFLSNFEIDPRTGEFRVRGGDLPWNQRNNRALPPQAAAAPEVSLPNGRKVDAGFVQQWQALVDQGVPPSQAVMMVRANRMRQAALFGQP